MQLTKLFAISAGCLAVSLFMVIPPVCLKASPLVHVHLMPPSGPGGGLTSSAGSSKGTGSPVIEAHPAGQVTFDVIQSQIKATTGKTIGSGQLATGGTLTANQPFLDGFADLRVFNSTSYITGRTGNYIGLPIYTRVSGGAVVVHISSPQPNTVYLFDFNVYPNQVGAVTFPAEFTVVSGSQTQTVQIATPAPTEITFSMLGGSDVQISCYTGGWIFHSCAISTAPIGN
jgi:hypothetical protein